MIIVLSQRIDTKSVYVGDEVFKVYHFPARYRKQIHSGDIFVYYQGNRYNKTHRFYFGTGIIGTIRMENDENYFAELLNVIRFKNTIPIYLPDGGYVEQLGYEKVRKSINPPWQTSIRPMSQDAYDYIMQRSGVKSIQEYNKDLKRAIQEYYISNDKKAIIRIKELAEELIWLYGLSE